MESNVDFLVA